MIQSPIPRSPEDSAIALCCYINQTPDVQVIRIANLANWYLERVVFPAQRLLFEAPEHAQLEVYAGATATTILVDKIACQRLQINSVASF
jgi:hypothetical protein